MALFVYSHPMRGTHRQFLVVGSYVFNAQYTATITLIMLLMSNGGMQMLQYPRYCNNSGSLTPLPCRVVNHCLVLQVHVLVITEG